MDSDIFGRAFLKFIYSEKATKFWKIFTLLLTVCAVVKSKVKISQNLGAFSEYMNFKKAFVWVDGRRILIEKSDQSSSGGIHLKIHQMTTNLPSQKETPPRDAFRVAN